MLKKPKIVAQVKGAKLQIWRTIPSGTHHVAFRLLQQGVPPPYGVLHLHILL